MNNDEETLANNFYFRKMTIFSKIESGPSLFRG